MLEEEKLFVAMLIVKLTVKLELANLALWNRVSKKSKKLTF